MSFVSVLSGVYAQYDRAYRRPSASDIMVGGMAVLVSGLSKLYRRGQTATTLKALVSGHRREDGEFWALKDVSFSVAEGEVLGIVGGNGSGKTTLLQIILGSVYPTSGTVQTHGPVTGMLSSGTGFSEEFTGWENVWQSARILGMTDSEIKARFAQMVEFSEIPHLMTTPLKRFSDGEKVRLAFSVLTQVPSPILLVDDTLAVGDIGFQHKCLEYIKTIDRTCLIVSHQMPRLLEVCDRVMWLRKGEIVTIGQPDTVISQYRADQ